MNKTYRLSLLSFAPLLLALVGIITIFSFAHADNYKQAFIAGTSGQSSAVLKVAGDESSIQYGLSGTGGMLECYAQSGPNMGTWVTVANLSSTGSIASGDIMSAGMYCNPNITTMAHLVQAMREGSVKLMMGGSLMTLMSGDTSASYPAMTSASTATSTDTSMGSSMGTTTGSSTPGTTGSMNMGTGSTTGDAASTSPAMSTTTASTTSTTGTATTTASTTEKISASDLRVVMNNLFREHVASSIAVLHDIIDGSPALVGSMQEQDANAVDLSKAVGLIYGPSAQATFLQLFRAHIADSNAYTTGIKNMSTADQQTALANLDTQLQQLSAFFAGANPNISYDGLLAALREHEMLVNKSSEMYAAGDYKSAYDYERQALSQISGGADALSLAIVLQYPTLFTY